MIPPTSKTVQKKGTIKNVVETTRSELTSATKTSWPNTKQFAMAQTTRIRGMWKTSWTRKKDDRTYSVAVNIFTGAPAGESAAFNIAIEPKQYGKIVPMNASHVA